MQSCTWSEMSDWSTLSDRSDSRFSTFSSSTPRRAEMSLGWVSSTLGWVAIASVTASRTMGTRASLSDWAIASVRRRVMVSCMVVVWCGVVGGVVDDPNTLPEWLVQVKGCRVGLGWVVLAGGWCAGLGWAGVPVLVCLYVLKCS